MSDFLHISVLGDGEAAASLIERGDKVASALERTMHIIVQQVKNNVVQNHLTGPTGPNSLTRRTGALARSVNTDVEVADGIEGAIFYTGDVPYAAIHEFGGVIHHPGGTAYIPNADKSGLMLFVSNANATADMLRTKPHDITIPERAPLRTGFREEHDWIVAQLRGAVGEGVAQ